MTTDSKNRLDARALLKGHAFMHMAADQPDPIAWLACHAGQLTERVRYLEHRLAMLEHREKRRAKNKL